MEAFVIILVVVFAMVMMAWSASRGRTILERWAANNGYRLIDSERRLLRKGPYFWCSSKGQDVFYVTVEDEQGRVRHGYVRCGGWFLGLLSDEATVEWDD
jgi:hypothetical protein